MKLLGQTVAAKLAVGIACLDVLLTFAFLPVTTWFSAWNFPYNAMINWIQDRAFLLVMLSPPLQLLGLMALAWTLWRTRRWRLLIWAVAYVVPLYVSLGIYWSCMHGDCI